MAKIDWAYLPVVLLVFVNGIAFLPEPINYWLYAFSFLLLCLAEKFKNIGLFIRKTRVEKANIYKACDCFYALNIVSLFGLFYFAQSWSVLNLVITGAILGVFNGTVGFCVIHEFFHAGGVRKLLSGTHVLYSQYIVNHKIHHIYYGTEIDPSTPKKGTSVYKHLWRNSFPKIILGFKMYPKDMTLAMFLNFSFLFIVLFLFNYKAAILLVTLSLFTWVQEEISNYIWHYGMTKDMPENFSTWSSNRELFNAMTLNLGSHASHHEKGGTDLNIDPNKKIAQLPFKHLLEAVTATLLPSFWFEKMDAKIENNFSTKKIEV